MHTIEYLREERNQKLKDSDWVVTKSLETGVAVPDAWKTYRQALRDLPATQPTPQMNENHEFVFAWPTPPIWPANVV